MTRLEKIATWILSAIGAVAGLWGAYTVWDASKFRQPFDEREQMAASFRGQIESAEKRKDEPEVKRIRVRYEQFEEGWRAGRKVAQLVAPVEQLRTSELGDAEKTKLREILFMSAGQPAPVVEQRTLGAAYLAVGEYERAVSHLRSAAATKDPNALALQSAAFSGLATDATTPESKQKYELLAAESFRAALATPKASRAELTGFAEANAQLSAILTERGVKLTNGSSGPAGAGR